MNEMAMAAMLFPQLNPLATLIATSATTSNSAGGLVFAFEQSTLPGKLVLLALFIASVFAWTVMVTKFGVVKRAKQDREDFLAEFRGEREYPLGVYEGGIRYIDAPVFFVYEAGCRELCYQVLGTTDVDEYFRERLDKAKRISPAQMRAVEAAMERAVGEAALELESQMILLATAVSGAPFLGLLGTVWGVMDTFSDVARAGSANLTAMAPGVSAALITTVTGLLVAIPAMFGYNFLLTTIRAMVVEMDNFSGELGSAFHHRYVDYSQTSFN